MPDNLRLGIDAVGAAGGVVECAIGYSGDCMDDSSKYNLEYYLTLARQLQESGIHVLAIKDMAGLLKPAAATKLITALRDEFPDLPIHVHTHDTAGTGVATYLACAHAGADAVDVAIDSMSGLTSQPAMGAVVGSLAGGHLDTGVQLDDIAPLIDYWESTRVSYAAFESGQKRVRRRLLSRLFDPLYAIDAWRSTRPRRDAAPLRRRRRDASTTYVPSRRS